MEEFSEAMQGIFEEMGLDQMTIFKAAEHFADPEDEQKLENFFLQSYYEWKKKGESFGGGMALKFLMPKLYKHLQQLQETFKEYDEQPGEPLS